MFQITGKTIKIVRGDTGIFTVNIMNGNTSYNYSNDEVIFTVKKNTVTDEILIQKTVRYGENVVIEPSDTNNLSYGEYIYDVQATIDGMVDTVIMPSKFIVLPEVTFGGVDNDRT